MRVHAWALWATIIGSFAFACSDDDGGGTGNASGGAFGGKHSSGGNHSGGHGGSGELSAGAGQAGAPEAGNAGMANVAGSNTGGSPGPSSGGAGPSSGGSVTQSMGGTAQGGDTNPNDAGSAGTTEGGSTSGGGTGPTAEGGANESGGIEGTVTEGGASGGTEASGGAPATVGGAAGEAGIGGAGDTVDFTHTTRSCPPTQDWPDDGIDQDNAGGDLTLADANAVFVATPAAGGDDANDGSHTHPKATLAAAVALARSAGKNIALAEGTYTGDGVDLRGLYVFGGYSSANWARDPVTYVSRIEVSESLPAGGMSPNADDYPVQAGGLEGLTVSGSATGPLVTDLGTGDAVQTSSTIRNCTLECTDCDAVIQFGYSGTVYENRVIGGGAGIRVDGVGGLGVTTNVRVCGNDVVGSEQYGYGIRVGNQARGPISVERNTITAFDATATAVRVDPINFLYATQDGTLEEVSLNDNIIQGWAAVAISSSLTPIQLAKNSIRLVNDGANGIDMDFDPLFGADPVHIRVLGNGILASGTAFAMHDPDTVALTLLNNSFRSGRGLFVEGNMNALSTTLVNNIFAADDTALEIDHGPIGFNVTTTLRNNDLLGNTCLIANAEFATCETAISSVEACTWDTCASASQDISADPAWASPDEFMLLSSSPCIDQGANPATWYGGPLLATDLEGTTRPAGAAWDIGADEQ